MRKVRLFVALVLSLIASVLSASDEKGSYFFAKVDHQQGLSNSAVLCLFQDADGLMWLGTYDGVNCWDSKSMETYRSDFSANTTLSNNVIHSVSQADSCCLWIVTHLGINRFSESARQVVGNYDFRGDYYLHSNNRGNTWLLATDGIYYYNTFCRNFCRIHPQSLPVEPMERRAFVTEDGTFWIFPLHTGQIEHYALNGFDRDTTDTQLTVSIDHFHTKNIEDVYYQNGVFCFIDCDKDLYVYDISRKSKIYIRNLATLVERYGVIAGIIPFEEDIIVAFRTNGLVRLRASRKYEEEIINRHIRVYCIYKDVNQGMLWIGSDGQGAMIYARKHDIATNLMLNRLSANLSRQVRSVLTDERGGLWFGTKGDGLLHLPHFRDTARQAAPEATVYAPGEKQRVSAGYTKWDKEFQVYQMVPSRYADGFWIGAGTPGLYYYSYPKDEVCPVKEAHGERPIEGVYGIWEANDTTLYVVTEGAGFYRLLIERKGGEVGIRHQKHYRIVHEGKEVTMFYPLLAEGDSLLWLGSRERGLVRFDRRTEKYRVISLKAMLGKPVDDVLSLHLAQDGTLYVGTTSGLVCLTRCEGRLAASYIGREQGLLNDMVHGVLEDDAGFVWLSTNRGLVKYNPANGTWHTYYYSAGIQIGEFSDGAYYRCPRTGLLFFGGIDGLLYMDGKAKPGTGYCPDILLRRLRVGEKEVNLDDYYATDRKSLQLEGPEAAFTLSFVAPDYLEQEELEYACMLEGFDRQWTPFSNRSEASYAGVPAGDYVFRVLCKKDVADTEYKSLAIPVHIRQPWYLSMGMRLAGCLLVGLVGCLLFYFVRRHYLREHTLKQQLLAERRGKAWRSDYTEKLQEFYPETFMLADHLGIRDLSAEVLEALEEDGVDVSPVCSAIPADFAFPVYKNALRCILYYCYLCFCRRDPAVRVTVDAREEEGRLLFSFEGPAEVLEELHGLLAKGPQPLSGKEEEEVDRAFIDQLLCGFIRPALERLGGVIRCQPSVEEGRALLELTFSPASTKEEEAEAEKKRVLLLEDNARMTWLITGLLSKEYDVEAVKSVQAALDEINRSVPDLFLVDMGMYVDKEEAFMVYVSSNRPTLCKTIFMPMLTWKAKTAVQRELIRWADAYIVLPHDILFLKEEIHKALYGKREIQPYIEELGQMAGNFFCSSPEQKDFVCRLLVVIEQNLQREDLGSSLLADHLGMSQSNFYRKFKEVSQTSPTDLIKNYRLEKAALLLQGEEEIPIQDIYTTVGLNSRSYFYREFVRKFGKTPKDYRDSERKGE